MKTLEECRKEIDQIDSEIIKLYEKRMDIVKAVTIFKKDNNIPVLDSSRENAMLDKNLTKITKSEYKAYYEPVLKGYLTASKMMQSELLKK